MNATLAAQNPHIPSYSSSGAMAVIFTTLWGGTLSLPIADLEDGRQYSAGSPCTRDYHRVVALDSRFGDQYTGSVCLHCWLARRTRIQLTTLCSAPDYPATNCPENIMPVVRRFSPCIMLVTAILLVGCADKNSEKTVDDAAATAEENPPATSDVQTAAGNPVLAPITIEDVGRWEKGMAGELKAVQEAGANLKTARTGEDTVNAMMGVQEMNTTAAGAQAAGLEQERYKFVRSNLSGVVQYLTPALGGVDTTMLSSAQRDEMRRMNEAQIQRMQGEVPAEVVEALRPRAVELRKKDMELVGARLKGAGM
jgi:hypothetical protein